MRALAAGMFGNLAGCASAPAEFTPTAQDRVIPAGSSPELLWNDGDFTEGPARAPDGSIVFIDIGNRILKFDPRTWKTVVLGDPSGNSNGLKFDPRGRLVAYEGAGGGNRRGSFTEADGSVRTLGDRWNGKNSSTARTT